MVYSDPRSGVAHTSDSDRDCPSRRNSETTTTPVVNTNPFLAGTTLGTRLGVIQTGNESESGGSQSPSPRASRRRQVI